MNVLLFLNSVLINAFKYAVCQCLICDRRRVRMESELKESIKRGGKKRVQQRKRLQKSEMTGM